MKDENQIVTIVDDEFYYVKQDFGEVDMPFKFYNVVTSSKSKCITEMSYEINQTTGNLDIVYTLNNGDKLTKHEIFKTKEQAASHARELNEQIIFYLLSDLKTAISTLAKLDLINLADGEFNSLMWFVANRMEEIEKAQQIDETDESIQRKNKA